MSISTTNLIFLFVGIFLLLMVAYAGIAAKDQLNSTNTSEVQDIRNVQEEQVTGLQKPFFMGLGGFYWIVLVVLILAGIGIFLKLTFGRRV